MPRDTHRVAIIGAGNVGAATAFALLQSGTASDLTLIDLNYNKAKGEALDLAHGLRFTSTASVQAARSYAALRGVDVVVVTAGVAQKPGQTRLDLAKINGKIVRNIVRNIMKYAPRAIVLIVTNPLDVMTLVALKAARRKGGTIFGSGTVLDSSRLRQVIGEKLKVDAASVHAYMLGEHGDSEFAVWSQARIGGATLEKVGRFSSQTRTALEKTVQTVVYKIIKAKGATYYGIALAVNEIVEAILNNKREMLTVSTLLENYHGLSDVCLSVPCIVGRNGVEKVIELKLSDKEEKSLRRSAEIVKQAYRSLR